MRAIDSEALIAQILNEIRRFNYDETKILVLAKVINMVDELPTIDAPKKGEWSYNPKDAYKYECPYCGKHFPDGWNFCPSCGADMREMK